MNVATMPTTAVSQSGTWTVQPGNTVNTTPWLVREGGDPTFSANSDHEIPSQKAVNTSIKQNRRKAWASGVMVNGIIPYLCKANVTNGAATLWLTDDGTSNGSAVFSSIYPEGIVINAYGSGNNYQVYNVVVSPDLKKVTCQVNQMAGAVLGLVNVTSAANGIDVRGIVLGTS